MNRLPDSESIVLVAVLPSLRDFEIARMLGWYRIPLRTAPKLIEVDYLAFYQPAAFGERKWRIEYFAPVLGHELVTRASLLSNEIDHPRAREEYFKLQLDGLVPLPQPIHANRWKRITFLYTTGEYLLTADTIHDLVVEASDRARLWRLVRDRCLAAGRYRSPELPAANLDPDLLASLLGMSGLASKDGKKYEIRGG